MMYALSATLLLAFNSVLTAETTDGLAPRERPSKGIENWSFSAKATNRNYDISVALPTGYATEPDRQFPAILVLDGNRMFGMTVDIARGLHTAQEAADLFIISIGTPFEEGHDAWVRRRIHEFSPDKNWPMTDSLGALILQFCKDRYQLDAADCVGGAPAFLALIQNELLPLLYERYRIDPSSLGLFGVSAGGFFASWSLLHDDSPFANYIISSPAMAYGDGEIFRLEARYAQHHDDLIAGAYMASGTLEIGTAFYEGVGNTVSGMTVFAGTLTARDYAGLRLSTGMHQGLGHSDAAAATLAIGIRTLYPK